MMTAITIMTIIAAPEKLKNTIIRIYTIIVKVYNATNTT